MFANNTHAGSISTPISCQVCVLYMNDESQRGPQASQFTALNVEEDFRPLSACPHHVFLADDDDYALLEAFLRERYLGPAEDLAEKIAARIAEQTSSRPSTSQERQAKERVQRRCLKCGVSQLPEFKGHKCPRPHCKGKMETQAEARGHVLKPTVYKKRKKRTGLATTTQSYTLFTLLFFFRSKSPDRKFSPPIANLWGSWGGYVMEE